MARQSPRAKKLPSNAEIAAFQRRIHSFYQREARTFPWRETKDPYAILVSEFMLQQTRTARVLHYYPRFLLALIAEGLIERRGRMILAPGTRIPKTRALTNSIRTIGQRKVSKSLHV